MWNSIENPAIPQERKGKTTVATFVLNVRSTSLGLLQNLASWIRSSSPRWKNLLGLLLLAPVFFLGRFLPSRLRLTSKSDSAQAKRFKSVKLVNPSIGVLQLCISSLRKITRFLSSNKKVSSENSAQNAENTIGRRTSSRKLVANPRQTNAGSTHFWVLRQQNEVLAFLKCEKPF